MSAGVRAALSQFYPPYFLQLKEELFGWFRR